MVRWAVLLVSEPVHPSELGPALCQDSLDSFGWRGRMAHSTVVGGSIPKSINAHCRTKRVLPLVFISWGASPSNLNLRQATSQAVREEQQRTPTRIIEPLLGDSAAYPGRCRGPAADGPAEGLPTPRP